MEKGKIYKGLEALELPFGSVLRVHKVSWNCKNVGDIIMRLNTDKQPFICLELAHTMVRGERYLWGGQIDNYKFEYIGDICTIEGHY